MVAALMVQGTGSDVGKSLIVAGLCRHFANRGLRVAPFKPQNMSNNAAVTADGGEIGRAQALQARACRIEPTVHLNPVLLKPEAETGAQLVVRGRRLGSLKARDYAAAKPALLASVLESFRHLEDTADLILVEGAGSPAEVNLRAGDIANMGFAEASEVPVILVADIHRGGVIASLVGSHAVLSPADRGRVAGFIINKFRGDARLFEDGLRTIEQATGWPGLGIVPHFEDASLLPAEDAMALEAPSQAGRTGGLRIVVPRLPRIANFDDLDPLRAEPSVSLQILPLGQALPGDTDLVILPGSKAVIADLAALRQAGWHIDLAAHVRRGGRILGLCGGYQMLGQTIADPDGIEGRPGRIDGLGHLDVETELTQAKALAQVRGTRTDSAVPVTGYEMHIGRTEGPDRDRPLFRLEGGREGAQSADGAVAGTYLHGIFAEDAYRNDFLEGFGTVPGGFDFDGRVDAVLDRLAAHLAAHLKLGHLAHLAGLASL